MSNVLEWAKREIEIACEKRKSGEFDYGCACYESVLKAFKSLYNDNHSGFSIKITQSILNRLIDGKPLTPIDDVDDIWCASLQEPDGSIVYQCNRMSSLFKTINSDGTVTYDDINRVICIDAGDGKNIYHLGLVRDVINDMFPITMPYTPKESIEVYTEDFLWSEVNGDFDTIGILYALRTNGEKREYVDIDRYFRTPELGEQGYWIEIDEKEYRKRRYESMKRRIENE